MRQSIEILGASGKRQGGRGNTFQNGKGVGSSFLFQSGGGTAERHKPVRPTVLGTVLIVWNVGSDAVLWVGRVFYARPYAGRGSGIPLCEKGFFGRGRFR